MAKGNPENHWTGRWSIRWYHMQELDTSSIWEEANEFRGLQCIDCRAKQISRNCSERYLRKRTENATKPMVYRLKISTWTDQPASECQYRNAAFGGAEPSLRSNFSELSLSSKSLAGTGSYTTRGRDIVNWTPWLYEVRGCSLFNKAPRFLSSNLRILALPHFRWIIQWYF